ncbi:hypothetical protein NQ318_006280 [Aromia moschata]|uniref:Uncharacterized protein n=1 Tax=Aromia moschata TaxID=1265417 RepID=A0AAV8YY61_9CUCU|nr:hypothetical protein NQ318_006280 [Aromia moschata]
MYSYRYLQFLHSPLRSTLGNILTNKINTSQNFSSSFPSHDFAKLKLKLFDLKCVKKINNEYAAVCAVLHRSSLQDINQLPLYLNTRNFHTTPKNLQDAP